MGVLLVSKELRITLRTVEFHRANLVERLSVSTLAELMDLKKERSG